MKRKAKSGGDGCGGDAANPRKPSRGGGGREERREERRVARLRADLVRGDALARLLMKGTINRSMYAAGMQVRGLYSAALPGMPAMDFTRERVQGGGMARENISVGMISSANALRQLLIAAQIGAEAARVVLMVCGEDMLLTAIAVDMEEDEEARKQGGHRRETAALVRYLIRAGLAGVARHLARREGRGDVAAGVRAWLADGAVPLSAATGERDDLPIASRVRG